MTETKDLTLENFISGDVFLWGIESAIFTESNPNEGPNGETSYPTNSFIIIFDSSQQKILATTKNLVKRPSEQNNIGDIYFESNANGGKLIINKIDSTKTKNLISDSDLYIADGFAIIRAFSTPEGFPDLDKNYFIMIKSKLDNKPIFNNSTEFIFNDSVIEFGAGK